MTELEVLEIRPGLWRWTAPHPEWTPEKGGPAGWERSVGCVYHEARDAVVLIDPLAPPARSDDEKRFWAALDRDVGRHGGPVAVLLSNRYHVRSTEAVYERYRTRGGASVWIHEAAHALVKCTVTHTFEEGQLLPGGIEPRSISGLTPDEVVFRITERRALVAADAILGAGAGELRLAPPSWADKGDEGRRRYETRFRLEIGRLLDVPFDMVLASHGPPVLENGHQALTRALANASTGE